MTANQAFRKAFGSDANFMTPRIMERGSTASHHWELSTGEGIFGGELFGVTVLTLDGERTNDLSQSFSSETEARTFIDTIE